MSARGNGSAGNSSRGEGFPDRVSRALFICPLGRLGMGLWHSFLGKD